MPEVFPQGGGNGFLAIVGELAEGGVVLCLNMSVGRSLGVEERLEH